MGTLQEFAASSYGQIIIRLLCVFFIGSMGSSTFLRKIANLFGLLSRGEKKKKIIFAFTDIISGIVTIFLSIFVSFLYKNPSWDEIFVYGEGLIYGFGSIGFHQFIIEGKLMAIVKTLRSKK